MKLSIVINNHNYAAFLPDCIESASAVRWADKEIIVVDDGSADDSRAIIESYGDRVVPILKRNGGQNDAANAGFERSTGEAVLFLDADDMLLPAVAEEVMRVWRPGVSCVQYAMRCADKDGLPGGRVYPIFSDADTPQRTMKEYRRTGFYRSSVTSGNVWSREFLAATAPIPVRETGLRWFDDYLHLLAPIFGDVISLPKALGLYRIHGGNDSRAPSGFSPDYIAQVCLQELLRERLANETARRVTGRSLRDRGITWEHFIDHMSNRLIHRRFRADSYPIDEGLPVVLGKYLEALRRAEMPLSRKMRLLGWGCTMALMPIGMAARVGQMRAKRPGIWASAANA